MPKQKLVELSVTEFKKLFTPVLHITKSPSPSTNGIHGISVPFLKAKKPLHKIPYKKILKGLKDNNLILTDTTDIQLKKIFTGTGKASIQWIGSPDAFHVFIDLLCKKLIEKPSFKWQTVMRHFKVLNAKGILVDSKKIKNYRNKISPQKLTSLNSIVDLLA